MRKRILISLALVVAIAGAGYLGYLGYKAWSLEGDEVQVLDLTKGFDEKALIEIAHDLSTKAYEKPEDNLPQELKGLDYDEHRDIRFVRDNGPWHSQNLPFEVQFFHLGSMFQISVPINEIIDGKVKRIKYSPDFFNYGKNNIDGKNFEELGYAGFRLHYPLNSFNYYDELVSFLGASYFRALGKGEKYGLSARGLAIDTAVQTGEEFPVFKEFWIKKPHIKDRNITVYALLDSPSVTGAYTFVITPGQNTTMEVNSTLFPRKPINKLGIAPLTSMYLFGENSKNKFDDHRPEVHDSDGLLVWNGKNEWLWRPLDNSKYLRISSFVDNNPKGFGLMQRDRKPEHYMDFEALYEQRPSVWVEPLDDWGNGTVQLVEIPSVQEIHDNVVAFWIPEEKLEPGKKYEFRYYLHWAEKEPIDNGLAKVTDTYTGIGGVSGMLEAEKRKFVVSFEDVRVNDLRTAIENGDIKPDVSVSEGTIKGVHLMYNPLSKGALVYVDYIPNGKTSEVRISLKRNDKNISEIWSYQWLP